MKPETTDYVSTLLTTLISIMWWYVALMRHFTSFYVVASIISLYPVITAILIARWWYRHINHKDEVDE